MLEAMQSFLTSDGFMPHGMCYLWEPKLLWLHVGSDALIGLSYMTIPPLLAYLVWRARGIMREGRPDADDRGLPHEWVFVAFAAFIIACGITHFISVLTVWRPYYWVSGTAKATTALISFATALALPPLLPRVFDLVRTARDSSRNVRELEAYVDELARSHRDLNDFTRVASHDLKAPLRGIDQLASFVLEDAGDVLPEASRDDLRLIRGRVKRMEALLAGIDEYAQIGRRFNRVCEVDPAAALTEALQHWDPDRRFTLDLDRGLPPIQGDPQTVRSIFTHLVSNAVKHHDGDRGVIRVTGSADASGITYQVEDDGPGIPSESRERVFELFQTLRPRDEVEGSGLGLAFIRKAMENVGGSVRIDAGSTGGTRVVLHWPADAGHHPVRGAGTSIADPEDERALSRGQDEPTEHVTLGG